MLWAVAVCTVVCVSTVVWIAVLIEVVAGTEEEVSWATLVDDVCADELLIPIVVSVEAAEAEAEEEEEDWSTVVSDVVRLLVVALLLCRFPRWAAGANLSSKPRISLVLSSDASECGAAPS